MSFFMTLVMAGAIALASILSLEYQQMSFKGESASETALDSQILYASLDQVLRDQTLCILAVSGGVAGNYPAPNADIPVFKLNQVIVTDASSQSSSRFNSVQVKDMKFESSGGNWFFHVDMITPSGSFVGPAESFDIPVSVTVTGGKITQCASTG